MRLIDADALLAKSFKYRIGSITTANVVMVKDIEKAPTIDTVPCDYEELVTKCHQLEEERDAARLTAKDFLKAAQKLKEERDAAVKEVSLCHYCRSCKHAHVSGEKEPCLSCNQCWAGKEKCKWEWRGIDE